MLDDRSVSQVLILHSDFMSPCRDSCKISSTYLHSTRPSYQVVKNCLCHAFERPCLHQCPCRCCDSWPAASQGSGVHGIRYLQVTNYLMKILIKLYLQGFEMGSVIEQS